VKKCLAFSSVVRVGGSAEGGGDGAGDVEGEEATEGGPRRED
jgi:hypothetical protein